MDILNLTTQQASNLYAGAGFISGLGSSFAQQAAGIQQQTSYQLNAINTLAIANVRADQEERYAAIQAGRMLQRAELESLNYKMAGNALLRNLERANATARARAAANGVAYGEGSAAGVQDYNIRATMRDVGVADFNALVARVMGFEDASAMLQNAEVQAMITRAGAQMQAGQYTTAAGSARRTSGLLADATLMRSMTDFAKTYSSTPSTGRFGSQLDSFFGGTRGSGD